MKIAVCARVFRPATGGLGAIAHAYAMGLLEHGWQPTVITHSDAPAGYDDQFPYAVIRRPDLMRFRRLLRNSDAVVFVHLSIIYILWSCFIRRPIISTIHGRVWAFNNLRAALASLFFECHLRLSPHAALISEVVRSPATRSDPVIGNAYDNDVFFSGSRRHKEGSVIFSGRINRSKGPFVLLDALQALRSKGLQLRATFVGSGPDEQGLCDAVRDAGLEEVTKILGHCEPARVAELLREHQIAAIPSDWQEPFGLVALEAIACGCYVVAFPDGGLPEAVGKAGLITASKSATALADGIRRLLTDSELRREIDSHRATHLENFTRFRVVSKLVDMINRALQSKSDPSR